MENFLIKPAHPTGSLDFLKRLRASQEGKKEEQAKVKLRVAIVGAGLGGLSTGLALARSGHSVTIYEAAPTLGEVGAGIQMGPNSTKHLMRWGVDKYMEGLTVEPTLLNSRRWQDGRIIGCFRLRPEMSDTYGANYIQIHRADFHTALKDTALAYGAQIRVDCKAVNFDFNSPSLTLESGEVVNPELIIAADGVKSTARQKFLGEDHPPESITGYAAYRGTIEASELRKIPDLRWLVETETSNIWIGAYRHIITYTVRAGELFNFVLLHPETRSPEQWEKDDFKKHMAETYKDWDPAVLKLISYIESPTKWPIMISAPMKEWASASGRFIVIGDAAHAMVPWMAQGAAMAIEDAAALEELLRLLPSKESLPKAMQVYQSVRIPRTKSMQQASLLNGYLLHLPDGPIQRARDDASRNEVEGKPFTTSSQQWTDPSTQRWSYGYDACEEMNYAWRMACGEQDTGLKSLL